MNCFQFYTERNKLLFYFDFVVLKAFLTSLTLLISKFLSYLNIHSLCFIKPKIMLSAPFHVVVKDQCVKQAIEYQQTIFIFNYFYAIKKLVNILLQNIVLYIHIKFNRITIFAIFFFYSEIRKVYTSSRNNVKKCKFRTEFEFVN